MITTRTYYPYGYKKLAINLSFIGYKDINGKEINCVKYSDNKDFESVITKLDEIPVVLKRAIDKGIDDVYEIPYLIYAHVNLITSRVFIYNTRYRRRGGYTFNSTQSYDVHFDNIVLGDNFAVRITRLNLSSPAQKRETHVDYDYVFLSAIENGNLSTMNDEQNKLVEYRNESYRLQPSDSKKEGEIKKQPPPDNFRTFKKIIKKSIFPNSHWGKDHIKNMDARQLYAYYYIIHELLKRTKEHLTEYLFRSDIGLNKNLCKITSEYVIEKSDLPDSNAINSIVKTDKLLYHREENLSPLP
jgi:hypothetical protein